MVSVKWRKLHDNSHHRILEQTPKPGLHGYTVYRCMLVDPSTLRCTKPLEARAASRGDLQHSKVAVFPFGGCSWPEDLNSRRKHESFVSRVLLKEFLGFVEVNLIIYIKLFNFPKGLFRDYRFLFLCWRFHYVGGRPVDFHEFSWMGLALH